MNATDAVKKAREVSADRAVIAVHYGANKREDRAIRITGTDKAGAEEVGREIAEAIGGKYRYAPGSINLLLLSAILAAPEITFVIFSNLRLTPVNRLLYSILSD